MNKFLTHQAEVKVALQILSALTTPLSPVPSCLCACMLACMFSHIYLFVFKACNVCVCSSAESEELAVHLYPGAVTVQGVLRRKTVLKEGKKPTVRTPPHEHTCTCPQAGRTPVHACTVQEQTGRKGCLWSTHRTRESPLPAQHLCFSPFSTAFSPCHA